uniref:Uncharacterized protein n=1 Tax=Timema tahoe TaxID=61484 RepID=A0A7R9NWX4_9NEOP|nr:unnamed protein product [Timema tahoe]
MLYSKVEAALMYDAVNLFAKAITQLDNNNPIEVTPLNCESGNIWPYGFALKNYMKHIKFKGMTGEISFDARGWRNHFRLDVVEVLYGGITKIGVWDSIDGINSTKTYEEKLIEIEKSIQNKTFIIFSKIGMPYLGWKDKNAEGNDRFEGFSKDLISEIMTMMNAKGFEFRLASDNNHGSLNKETGKWNGIMKEIIDRVTLPLKGDLGICDLTITYDRRQAVDFTMPFMNLGISILFTKPVKEDPELFSFLKPFSFDVWIFLATAYLTISLILFFLARITPYEWDNPNPNDPDPDELETSFNILNCLWFSIGTLHGTGMRYITEVRRTLMAQGCDILPRAVSTRMLACIWWFFLLILNSSYTANLAAFLTTSRIEESINNAEDLASQTRVKVGALRGGATASFFSFVNYRTFTETPEVHDIREQVVTLRRPVPYRTTKNSNNTVYQQLSTMMMKSKPDTMTSSNQEGVERVLKDKRGYAFFMESISIEYEMERKCDLMQINNLLDNKGYGIALPINSPYRTFVSKAILKLTERGILTKLKDKWWKVHDGTGCSATPEEPSSDELDMANVGGVFLVVVLGCVAAFLVSLLEFLWNCRKIAVEEKTEEKTTSTNTAISSQEEVFMTLADIEEEKNMITPWEAIVSEFKFAINLSLTTKPVRKKKGDGSESSSRSDSGFRL